MNQISKCARGQIWYAEPDLNVVRTHGRNPYYSKLRPYLIVSNDQGNFSSPDIIALPITTSNTGSPRSVDVVFDLNGTISRIACNKPTQLAVDQLCGYKATLSPGFMEDVERAMALSLGMSDRWILRDKQVTELKNLISEYRQIQMMISNMKQNMIDSYSDITAEFIRTIPTNPNKSSESDGTIKVPRKSIKWDEKSMREFVDDYENNPIEAMMEYYGYTSEKSVKNTYYRLRKELASIDAANKEDNNE